MGRGKKEPERSTGEAVGEGAEEEIGSVEEDHHAGAAKQEELKHPGDQNSLSLPSVN